MIVTLLVSPCSRPVSSMAVARVPFHKTSTVVKRQCKHSDNTRICKHSD